MSLSADAQALLERAQAAEHAVDLYLAPGATRLTADRIVEILDGAPSSLLHERALWNLLFAAGELSLRLDVYRALELFRAAGAACARVAAEIASPTDPRAPVVEMAFDFFFARPAHPLLPLRSREVLSVLVGLLSQPSRVAARTALHGLGHLLILAQQAGLPALAADAGAAIDEFARGRDASPADATLLELADEARAGALR